MQGGTTFHSVDASPQEALELAISAADGQDVIVGGGASTIRQFLAAGLIDDMHFTIVPVLLLGGERLFDPVSPALAGYECAELACGGGVAHARITRRAGG